MKRTLVAMVLVLLAIGGPVRARAQARNAAGDRGFFPLSKGNSWKYQVSTAQAKTAIVEWRVTAVNKTREGIVYLVWPFPKQGEAETRELRVSARGVEEVSTGILILKMPVAAGEVWTAARPSMHVFRVLSLGRPCRGANLQFQECIVVEDRDEKLDSRTVTTYARNVGPVKALYYKKGNNYGKPARTVELISYQLVP